MTRERAYILGEQIKVPSLEQRSKRIEEFVDRIYDDFDREASLRDSDWAIKCESLEQRILELEADNKELAKDFTHSKYVDKYIEPKDKE